MTPEEKAFRLTAMTEMFSGYGKPATEEQLKWYGNLTKHVPAEVFRQAIASASIESRGSFPPGPGDIIAAALVLAPGEQQPGYERALPRWYRRALGQLRDQEKPKELGFRSGMQEPGQIDFRLRAAGETEEQ